ncbi:MAG: polysaccharide biosynthesis protein [Eubacteriales bacterium]
MSNQRNSKNPGFVMQGVVLASASIIVRVIGLLYRIPLTNILGDEGNGLYSYAFEIYNIALLLSSYSLPLAVSKLVSARANHGERNNAYRVFKLAMVLAVIIGAIVGITVYVGSDFIAGTVMKAPMSAYAVRVLAPCLFIVAILGVMRGYCQGLGTTIPTATSQILEQIINAIVSIVAASYFVKIGMEITETTGEELMAAALGAAGGTTGTVMGALTALIFMSFVLFTYRKVIRKQIARERNVVEEPYSDILKILTLTAVPVILSTAIYNINSILDQGLYNNIMSTQGFLEEEYYALWGMYSGKYKVLQNVPLSVSNSFATSVIPSLTIAVVAKNRREAHEKIGLAIRLSMLIAIPSFVGFLIFAEPILNLLFSGDNTTASYIMMIGSVAIIFYCLSTVTNGILQGLNKMTVPIKNAAISLVIHLVFLLLFLCVFKWHVYSVVLSSAIFALSMCLLNARAIRKYSRYEQEIKKTFILPMLSAIVMGIVSYLAFIGCEMLVGEKVAIIIAIVIAGITYMIALLKTGAMPEEDIYNMPKGNKLVHLLKKVKLL